MADFFISYAHNDAKWAEWIAWQLEAVNYSTLIQVWDFQAGANFVLEMDRAAKEAERTIAVLSPDYLNRVFTQSEWAVAFAVDPLGRRPALLPVRVRSCQLTGLLAQVIYIDLVGLDEVTARDTLLRGVRKERKKPSSSPEYPSKRKRIDKFAPAFPVPEFSQPKENGVDHGQSGEPGKRGLMRRAGGVPQKQDKSRSSNPQLSVSAEIIDVASEAVEDCETLKIAMERAVAFVSAEAVRHPLLFGSEFSSVPLVFGEHVLLLSWTGKRAIIERIMTRSHAYPTNDLWIACLGGYRQATLLPYRTQSPDTLLLGSEGRRSVTRYRDLVSKVKALLGTASRVSVPAVDLDGLLDEAEFALANGDIGAAVTRMEVVLSTLHKIILRLAPTGTSVKVKQNGEDTDIVLPPWTSKPSVLLVDDEPTFLDYLKSKLQEGLWCDVIVADQPSNALKLLVERSFDLVITDLVFDCGPGYRMDGREIARAAKGANPSGKVVICTAYWQMSNFSDLFEIVDDMLSKNDPFSIMRIKKLMQW